MIWGGAIKSAILAVLYIAIWVWPGCLEGAATSPPVFAVREPTIIAFFPVTQSEVDGNADDEEALSDFDYYVSLAEKRLHSVGVAINVVNARSFQIRVGKKLVNFQPMKNEIGYYFIAPGKLPHIEHGVMTDVDILAAARKYFGIPIQ
jgi:hypothetical protein